MERTCKKCGETKQIEEFRNDKRNESGYGYICKNCVKIKDNLRIDRIRESARKCGCKYRQTGKARLNWIKWAKDHPEILKQKNKEYYHKYSEKLKEKRILGKYIWKSRSKEYQLIYRIKNKQKINLSSNKYMVKSINEINDSYAYSLLKYKGYSKMQIIEYPKLLECQRLITKIKRLTK